jgi:hypothetical protein
MTEEQARELAKFIKIQFPFHVITVEQSSDVRNAPKNWLIDIRTSGPDTGKSLLIHNPWEWDDALLALSVLKDG